MHMGSDFLVIETLFSPKLYHVKISISVLSNTTLPFDLTCVQCQIKILSALGLWVL